MLSNHNEHCASALRSFRPSPAGDQHRFGTNRGGRNRPVRKYGRNPYHLGLMDKIGRYCGYVSSDALRSEVGPPPLRLDMSHYQP